MEANMIDNLIMVAVGIVATLMGFGKIPVSKNALKNREYLEKYGKLVRVCGILLIVIGVVLSIANSYGR
jgi:multisubunit Na+/H+ antiporter MnhB subunit